MYQLRIAFANFSWYGLTDATSDKPVGSTSPDARSAAIAFPAVRGEVCVGKGRKKFCESWAPCPEAGQCQCEYYYDDLYCFDENAGFNAWKDSWISYPETVNKKWLGNWWALNDTVPAGYSIDINSTFTSRRDDDTWAAWATCAVPHTIELVGSPIAPGWGSASYSIDLCNDARCSSTTNIIRGPSSTFASTGSELFFLCPDDTYTLTVDAGTVDINNQLSWTIRDKSGTALKVRL